MAFCSNCGATVEKDDLFCPLCGQDLIQDKEIKKIIPTQEIEQTKQHSLHNQTETILQTKPIENTKNTINPKTEINDDKISKNLDKVNTSASETPQQLDENPSQLSRKHYRKSSIPNGTIAGLIGFLILSITLFMLYRQGILSFPNTATSGNSVKQTTHLEQSSETTTINKIVIKPVDKAETTTHQMTQLSETTVDQSNEPSSTTTTTLSEETSTSNRTTVSQNIVIKPINTITTEVSNSEQNSNTQQTTSIPISTFDNQKIAALFNLHFGSLSGQHSLYFRQITQSDGQIVQATPLAYNDIALRSASVIKLFVLGAIYQQAEQGNVSLDSIHVLKESDKVGGTGNIQNLASGTEYTLRYLAQEMIINSDNTAMNIIIDYIGFNAVNDFITNLGYSHSSINRKMLDTDALNRGIDNYITASEAGDMLYRLYTKDLVSPTADQEMLAILKQQNDKEHLEALLPSNITTYNKTGKYSTYGVRNDVAIIETEKGAYVLAVISQDGNESDQINAMQQFGLDVFNVFNTQ